VKTSIVTSIAFAILAILFIVTLSYRIPIVLELAVRPRTASHAEIDKTSASNSQENKSIIVAVGIEQFKIRILFFACVTSMAISAICSYIALKKHMETRHSSTDGGIAKRIEASK